MSIRSIEPRVNYLGNVTPFIYTSPAATAAITSMVIEGNRRREEEKGFLATHGVAIAAGAGAFVLGALIAVAAKGRKKGRR